MIFNKWKGKSIYQIVLLDRANKLQDVVYFSLQVHLYNQHVISNLNNINHRPVMLRNVMSTTSVNEFLGSRRCYLYKIPFQLNHMDTENNQHNLIDENMTNSVDDYNWDSPLSRCPEPRTAFKILKHSFAVRDQGVQVDITTQAVRFSDTDYNKPQFENKLMHQKPEEKPIRQPVNDNRYSMKEKNDSKVVTTPNKTNIKKPLDKSNPVLELQSKGKQYQSAAYADEDDPPYNFQAILKKTNYKRPSLDGRTIQFSSEKSIGGRMTYGGGHADAVQRMEEDYGRETAMDNVKRSKDYKNELNHKLSKATSRTEIIPGVMLEGSSYDL